MHTPFQLVMIDLSTYRIGKDTMRHSCVMSIHRRAWASFPCLWSGQLEVGCSDSFRIAIQNMRLLVMKMKVYSRMQSLVWAASETLTYVHQANHAAIIQVSASNWDQEALFDTERCDYYTSVCCALESVDCFGVTTTRQSVVCGDKRRMEYNDQPEHWSQSLTKADADTPRSFY